MSRSLADLVVGHMSPPVSAVVLERRESSRSTAGVFGLLGALSQR